MRNRALTNREPWNSALTFLIGMHDLGKISTCFRNMICGDPYVPIRHWQLSFRLLRDMDDFLGDRLGSTKDVRKLLYAAVAGHHGGPPESDNPWQAEDKRLAIGEEATKFAKEAVKSVLNLFPCPSLEGMEEKEAKKISWLLSGLTIQADWIGSNQDWFSAKPPDMPIDQYWRCTLKSAEDAVSKAGLYHAKPKCNAHIMESGKFLSPMQAAVQELLLSDGPEMVMIEDSTGSGKTEAALILSARMMEVGKGKGIFFALPTMATSNAMLTRLERVVPKLFDGTPSLRLSHGRFKQNRQFMEIAGRDGSDPEEPVTCGQWLADDRRWILFADVGVGTIDQALMSVLPTRFNTLRLWALSGKILVVDEAHSYDPYMEKELCRLLHFHAMLGGSAIVMTATLPKGMRKKYADAFQRGLGKKEPQSVSGNAYPALTVIGEGIDSVSIEAKASARRDINIHRVNLDKAFEVLCNSAYEGAACVWVRNAVDDAISAVRKLREKGIDAHLLHARFTVADRNEKESALQRMFGRDGCGREGQVLVATQVVEASLDLDFDVMVSDLAPIESLIQRAGRLWRHMDLRPATNRAVGEPVLHIVSPDPSLAKDESWLQCTQPSGRYVYSLDVQWRTIRALLDAGAIKTPVGMRNLIEAVHGENPIKVPEFLENIEIKTAGKEICDRQQAQNSLLEPSSYFEAAQKVFDEEQIQTRLGEPQRTLWLAKEKEGSLVPFADKWIMSEVKVSAARYDKNGGVEQESQVIKDFKEKEGWPEWKKNQINICPVANCGRICRGLKYDKDSGLVFD